VYGVDGSGLQGSWAKRRNAAGPGVPGGKTEIYVGMFWVEGWRQAVGDRSRARRPERRQEGETRPGGEGGEEARRAGPEGGKTVDGLGSVAGGRREGGAVQRGPAVEVLRRRGDMRLEG